MNSEEALSIWAPHDSPWSRFTKAVLFSFMQGEITETYVGPNMPATIPLMQDMALVINLAGAQGIEQGLALAEAGYRPVPLYNACPYAIELQPDEFPSMIAARGVPIGSRIALIDLVPILRRLETGANFIKQTSLPPSAPPAFLLDAARFEAAFATDIGLFDNRSDRSTVRLADSRVPESKWNPANCSDSS